MKRVVIDNNSWHYKFNKWTYGSYYKPTTLCPYFWKTLLALVIIPLVLIGKCLVRVFENYEAPDWDISYRTQRNIWKDIKICFLSLIVVGLIYAGVMGYWEILSIIGMAVLMVGGSVIVGVGIMFGIDKLVNWSYHPKYEKKYPSKPHKAPKEKNPNILISYIKAWYHNNCPLIDYSD